MVALNSASCRRIAATAAVALHAAAAIVVMTWNPTPRRAEAPPTPILVRWIEPAVVKPSQAAAPQPLAPAVPKPPPRKTASKPPQKRAVPTPAPRVVQRASPTLIATTQAPSTPELPLIETPHAVEPAPAPALEPARANPPTAAKPSAAATATPTSAMAAPPPPVSAPAFDAAYLNNPPPRYPARSRRLGETGRVVLRVLVTASGNPERVELRTSSGSQRLDSAALETVQRWKFVPARQGDTAVPAWVLVPILFTLEG